MSRFLLELSRQVYSWIVVGIQVQSCLYLIIIIIIIIIIIVVSYCYYY